MSDNLELGKKSIFFLVICFLVSGWAIAQDGTMRIAWDPVVEWGSGGEGDYIIGKGLSSGEYTGFQISADLEHTVTGLSHCADNYVAVKARAGDPQLEGPWSVEVEPRWPRPLVRSVQCDGSDVLSGPGVYSCVLDGGSIRMEPAGSVEIPVLPVGQGVPVIGNVEVTSCMSVTFDLDMTAVTVPMELAIRVTNPDGTFGGRPAALTYSPVAPVEVPGVPGDVRRIDR